jgi:hypothetical protein
LAWQTLQTKGAGMGRKAGEHGQAVRFGFQCRCLGLRGEIPASVLQ